MKKIIAVLIVIAMSFGLYACGSSSTNISTSSKNSIPQELLEKLKANSHTPVDAVISFRSFQWFEKLNDVKKFINENNDPDIGNVSDIGDILSVDHYILPAIIEDKQIITFDDVKDDYRIYPNVKGKKISITKRTDVAGYPATITMYFLYPIIDGKIIENNDYAEFVEAKYIIHVYGQEKKKAYGDLLNKLTQLYGSASAETKDLDTSASNSWDWTLESGNAVWRASDGSILHLEFDNLDNMIHYYAPSAGKIISENSTIAKAAWDAERTAKEKDFSNNKNGL